MVSFGVVIAGIIISYTGIKWIDPAISLAIMIVVISSTWKLLTESLRLTLDAVPENVDIEKVKQQVEQMPGVKNIHHIHVWAMSTTKNAMTAHLIVEDDLAEKQIVELSTNSNTSWNIRTFNMQHWRPKAKVVMIRIASNSVWFEAV